VNTGVLDYFAALAMTAKNIKTGGVLNPFVFESSTLTIVLQQIIALKTIERKFSVATPHEGLIPAPGMASSYSDESTVSTIRSSFGMV
tara:strand:- start:731 stop:994 length:264 start_codon:yes stop_codon:yes gene_type:complete